MKNFLHHELHNLLHLKLIRLGLQIRCHVGEAAARGGNLLHARRLLLSCCGDVMRLAADALCRGIHSAHALNDRVHVLAQFEDTLADGERCGLDILDHVQDQREGLARRRDVLLALLSLTAPFLHRGNGVVRLLLDAADELGDLL